MRIVIQRVVTQSNIDQGQFFLRELMPIFAPNLFEMTPKFHALNILEVRRETEDTVSIAFEVYQGNILLYEQRSMVKM
jgi:hypothetical protein